MPIRINTLAKRHKVKSKVVLNALRELDRHFIPLTWNSEIPMQPLEIAAFEDAFLGGHIHVPMVNVLRQEFGDHGHEQTICECGVAIVEDNTGTWSTFVDLDAWMLNLLKEAGFRRQGHTLEAADCLVIDGPVGQSVAHDML